MTSLSAAFRRAVGACVPRRQRASLTFMSSLRSADGGLHSLPPKEPFGFELIVLSATKTQIFLSLVASRRTWMNVVEL